MVDQEEFIEVCSEFLKQGLESGYHTYWIAEQAGEIISQVFMGKSQETPQEECE